MCRLFKATNQNIIAPAVIALRFSSFGQKYTYKDKKKWRVFVHINEDNVIATNQRGGESYPKGAVPRVADFLTRASGECT